jgi:hypothetical protein
VPLEAGRARLRLGWWAARSWVLWETRIEVNKSFARPVSFRDIASRHHTMSQGACRERAPRGPVLLDPRATLLAQRSRLVPGAIGANYNRYAWFS